MRFDEVSSLIGQTIEVKRWPAVAWRIPEMQPLIRESGRLILVSVHCGNRETLQVSDVRRYLADGFIVIRKDGIS